MASFLRDAVHAVRVLAARPVLTATTVATLAVGIGGASAMFAVANGLLLRPLPVPDADRLVRVFGASDIAALGITSYPNLQDVADRARSFDGMTIHQQTFAAYGLGDETLSAAVELVSGGYFRTFGVATPLGRSLAPDDDRTGAPRVVVISDGWWRRHFAADAAVIGQTLHLNGAVFTVAGVAPPSFHGSYDALHTDLWVPLMTYDVVRPRGLDITRRTWGWLQASARLAPGVSLASARAEVAAIAAALRAEYPRENRALGLSVVPASTLPESLTPDLRRGLVFALAIAALALLAACANVANASLATVTDRRAEIAVRMALGATRADIARQWLAESLVATAAATAVGLLLAVWLRDGLFVLRPLAGFENFAPSLDLGWPVWGFAAALMAAATGLAGVLPALRAAGIDPAQPLREGATANIGGGRGGWMRAALVSAQAAVAVALVVLAGLLGQSLAAAGRADLGFDPSGLVIARANVSALGHDDARSYVYHVDTMARVRALPGAAQATAASVVPLGTNDERRVVTIDGYTPPDDQPISLPNNVVWPGYFEVMCHPDGQWPHVRRGGWPALGAAGGGGQSDDGEPLLGIRLSDRPHPAGRRRASGGRRRGPRHPLLLARRGADALRLFRLRPAHAVQRRPDVPRARHHRPGGDGPAAHAGTAGARFAGARRRSDGLRGAARRDAVPRACDGLAEHRLRSPGAGAAPRRHLRRDRVRGGGAAA